MSLVSMFQRPGPNGFGVNSTAEEVTAGVDLSGKTFLLTGCNSGLGRETLRVLSLRGAHVIGAARTVTKAQDTLDAESAEGTAVACDLSEPASVRAAVEAVKSSGHQLDGIICNAGIMALPKLETKHGLELQFLTNHIGHFILVTGLLDEVQEGGRIVVVSSSAHNMTYSEGIQFDNLDGSSGYQGWKAYGQSKLSNLLFAKHLATRVEHLAVASLHPGVIQTNLGRHMNPAMRAAFGALGNVFSKSIPQGAATQCYLAAHPDAAGARGEYYADCNLGKPSRHGRDAALAERLWAKSEELVAGL